MKFITPPENQGQIVEIAFASAGEFVIKKVFDRSDRSETFYLAEIAGDDWGWYENWSPVNGAPPGDLEWVEISERDLRRKFDLGPSGVDAHGVCRGCGAKVQPTDDDPSWDYCEC